LLLMCYESIKGVFFLLSDAKVLHLFGCGKVLFGPFCVVTSGVPDNQMNTQKEHGRRIIHALRS